jgi:hypothetical protein
MASTACAPLASANEEIMKMISPAPAAASLIHMTAISRFLDVCSILVLIGAQEQNKIKLTS